MNAVVLLKKLIDLPWAAPAGLQVCTACSAVILDDEPSPSIGVSTPLPVCMAWSLVCLEGGGIGTPASVKAGSRRWGLMVGDFAVKVSLAPARLASWRAEQVSVIG